MTGLLRYPRLRPVPLDQNPGHAFAAAHALMHYASGTVYSFIPKNGCTTMRLSLALANNCIESADEFAWVHSNNDTFRASLSDLVRAPKSFVILRCPHARLASAFLDKIVGRERDMWDLLRHSGEAFDPDAITFRRFVDLLENDHLRAMNIHWRSQGSFLVYQNYTHWFALEQFRAAQAVIEGEIGLKIHDARALSRHGSDLGGRIEADACFADTPAFEILQMRREGKSLPLRRFYDDAVASGVARLYADDLRLYDRRCCKSDLLFPALVKEHTP